MDVKTLCLGILTLGEASGYEIKKQFEEGPISLFYHAGFGSIYPALGKLYEEGLVTCTEMAQAGRPDKKIYTITPKGMEYFRSALNKKPAPDKIRSENLLTLYFGQHLNSEECQRVFDQYIEENRQTLEFIQGCDVCGEARGMRFVHGLGEMIHKTIIEYMENNRHILFEDDNSEPGALLKTGTGK